MPQLYRKRLIPEELVHLKDDYIIFFDKDIIVTKWNVLKPRKDFSKGFSCYFLKKGFKISKFLNENDEFVYYYCDIIDTSYQKETDTFVFTDLLADVIIYKDGFVKVVDLDEISEALENGIIDISIVKKLLYSLDELLQIIYTGNLENLIGNYLECEGVV